MTSAALLSAAAQGLEAGLTSFYAINAFEESEAATSTEQLLAEYRRTSVRTKRAQRLLLFIGGHAAGLAFLKHRSGSAAAPLAASAALNLGVVLLSVLLVEPVDKQLRAAKAPEAGQARRLLVRWSRLQTARAALGGLAFGGALCGLLLLRPRSSKQ